MTKSGLKQETLNSDMKAERLHQNMKDPSLSQKNSDPSLITSVNPTSGKSTLSSMLPFYLLITPLNHTAPHSHIHHLI